MNVATMNLRTLILVLPVCLALVSPGRAQELLYSPCPVDWAGTPLAQALSDLAGRLKAPYILDASVTDDVLQRRVRFTAAHLDGRQALRWTAKSVGLDAVLVDGAMVIAAPERLPGTWRLTGTAGSPPVGLPEHLSRWQAARAVKKDMAWVDVPLSRVARDISTLFGVDVVFSPEILSDQGLVRLEGTGLGLDEVLKAISEQLQASARFEDGVIWIQPSRTAESRPAVAPTDTPAMALAGPVGQTNMLGRAISVDFPGPGADTLGQALRQAGVDCRVEPGVEQATKRLQSRGTLAEILEAGRMLEGWDWRMADEKDAQGPVLVLRTAGSPKAIR